jgi:hypothetical protein
VVGVAIFQLAAFLHGHALANIKRWRLIPTSANGQPALAGYLWDEQTEAFMRYCLYVPHPEGTPDQ